MTAESSLWTLFASSFLAATLLPGGSEAVLFGVLQLHPEQVTVAVVVATVGNTLGGMTSYCLGRVLPRKKEMKGLAAVQRFGAPALVLSWVPLIGDALCVAAGWLRLSPLLVVFFMALGKLARYAAVAALSV